jgi:alpha-mannosidase
MPRQDKYYGTNTFFGGRQFEKLKELGYKGFHNQFRIVCKAKSMAEANRIAEAHGLSKKCFNRDYTSETGNSIQLEMADKYGFIVCIDGTSGDRYMDIKELL